MNNEGEDIDRNDHEWECFHHMARVLVIDDDRFFLKMLRGILQSLGHQVATAEDGIEGLEKIKDGRFDLVITDVFMPRQEGVETLINLKAHYPGLKVFVMSGGGRSGNMDFLEVAKSFGADEIFAKPFSLEDLKAALERANL